MPPDSSSNQTKLMHGRDWRKSLQTRDKKFECPIFPGPGQAWGVHTVRCEGKGMEGCVVPFFIIWSVGGAVIFSEKIKPSHHSLNVIILKDG